MNLQYSSEAFFNRKTRDLLEFNIQQKPSLESVLLGQIQLYKTFFYNFHLIYFWIKMVMDQQLFHQ